MYLYICVYIYIYIYIYISRNADYYLFNGYLGTLGLFLAIGNRQQ